MIISRPPVKVAVGEAVEAHDGADQGEFQDTEDPGGDCQGGPVHVPQVPDDHRDRAAQALTSGSTSLSC